LQTETGVATAVKKVDLTAALIEKQANLYLDEEERFENEIQKRHV